MAQLVEVPGVGTVEFPDGMSEQQIAAALQGAHPPQQQAGFGDRLLRQAGLAARYGIEGVGGIADTLASPIRAGMNALLPDGMQAHPVAPQLADALNLPKPETATERVVGDASRAVAGAMTGAGAANLSQPVSGIGQALKGAFATAPGMQGVSAATGATSAGIARENGVGPVGQLVAGVAGGMAPSVLRSVAAAGAGSMDQTKRELVNSARKEGYVLPPSQSNPSLVNQTAEGLAGKIKTAQSASVRNQPITQSLTKRALGIADDTPLSVEALEQVRKQAAGAYEAARALGPIAPAQKYFDQLDDAVKPFTKSAQSFPDAKLPPVVGDIAALKSPAIDADSAVDMIQIVRDKASQAFANQDAGAGRAYSAAAKALEGLLEDHAVKIGAPQDVVQRLREARRTIAMTYSVQKAINAATGNVSAPKLGAQLARGTPFTGDLRTVANMGLTFPKATQAVDQAGSVIGLSPLDFGTAALTYGASGNPWSFLGLVARPGVRSAILSKPYQNTLAAPGGLLSPSELIGAGALGTQYGLKK